MVKLKLKKEFLKFKNVNWINSSDFKVKSFQFTQVQVVKVKISYSKFFLSHKFSYVM